MKASPQKSGDGYITAYRLIIGSQEARLLGFVDEDGTRYELIKEMEFSSGNLLKSINHY